MCFRLSAVSESGGQACRVMAPADVSLFLIFTAAAPDKLLMLFMALSGVSQGLCSGQQFALGLTTRPCLTSESPIIIEQIHMITKGTGNGVKVSYFVVFTRQLICCKQGSLSLLLYKHRNRVGRDCVEAGGCLKDSARVNGILHLPYINFLSSSITDFFFA